MKVSKRRDRVVVLLHCSEPQHCALLRSRTLTATRRLVSGVQKVESRGDRFPNGPILGRASSDPGLCNPCSVARALSRAACAPPVFRRASDFAPPRFGKEKDMHCVLVGEQLQALRRQLIRGRVRGR